MKAISLWQPWASAIPMGLKSWETRGWSTNYRGEFAIHAAKKWDSVCQNMAHDFGMPELPRGQIIAVATLIDVYPTELVSPFMTDHEKAWGDYTPGRFAWCLGKIRKVKPFEYKGGQGWFNVPDELFL
jgi:activating signal cointegrator 1